MPRLTTEVTPVTMNTTCAVGTNDTDHQSVLFASSAKRGPPTPADAPIKPLTTPPRHPPPPRHRTYLPSSSKPHPPERKKHQSTNDHLHYRCGHKPPEQDARNNPQQRTRCYPPRTRPVYVPDTREQNRTRNTRGKQIRPPNPIVWPERQREERSRNKTKP